MMKKILKDWYSEKPDFSKDYCRIVTDRHFTRLQAMLSKTKGSLALGGSCKPEDKYMEPTVVTGVDLDDATMQVKII